jgi:hypothetical protein
VPSSAQDGARDPRDSSRSSGRCYYQTRSKYAWSSLGIPSAHPFPAAIGAPASRSPPAGGNTLGARCPTTPDPQGSA